jgi:hemolysin activation/secretion protein
MTLVAGLLMILTEYAVSGQSALTYSNEMQQQRQQQQERRRQLQPQTEPLNFDKYVQCENVLEQGGTTVNPVVLEGKRFYDEVSGEYFPIKGEHTSVSVSVTEREREREILSYDERRF